MKRKFKLQHTAHGIEVREWHAYFQTFVLVFGWANTLIEAENYVESYVAQTAEQGSDFTIV